MPRKPSEKCRFGHLMSGDNLITHKRPGGKIGRECRTCANNRYANKRRARKRNKALTQQA